MEGINVNDVDIIVQLRLQDEDFTCEKWFTCKIDFG